jgi:4-alpha-glucanotransferase
MNAAELERLETVARSLGVQTEFVDATGERRRASVETLRAAIELLGPGTHKEDTVPPVFVCWNGQPKTFRLNIRLPSTSKRFFPLTPALSSEGEPGVEVRRASASLATLHIPALPFGYYDLVLELDGTAHRLLIISAPTRAYAPRYLRAWGVFAPMYAVHSKRSWGAGDLTAWQQLCESLASSTPDYSGTLTKRRDSSVAATLPLLGAFLDEWKCEPSPYSPATRLFWNEFYVDVMRVPEFSDNRGAQKFTKQKWFQRALQKFRASDLVDYEKQMDLKRSVVEKLSAEFFRADSPWRREFQAFVAQRPELQRYAEFRATRERQRKEWQAWPAQMSRGRIREKDFNSATKDYFLFTQWLTQKQIDEVLASRQAGGVQLYLDLPLGVNPDGYDVWAHQDLFVHNASVGAPPDAFFTKGQDWGFPPLHPRRIREERYQYVIDYLRFQMRHAGLLRLDHVMGLHRLWWIPRGAPAAEGVYVSYNAEELYAILCLESHRHQTMLVGENLGTVPPEVNRSMKRHGLRTMYVTQYELQPNSRRALRKPPRDCVASLNTHDMPTWAAFWKGLDIADRKRLGLLTGKQAGEERKRRAQTCSALVKFLRRKNLLIGKATARSAFEALSRFLFRSDAEVVLLNLEDFWMETRPQNTPGTTAERINWRRKMKLPLETALERLCFTARKAPASSARRASASRA